MLQAVQTLVCQMPVDANMEHAEAFLKSEAIYGRVFAYALHAHALEEHTYMILTLPKLIRFEQARCSLLKRVFTFAQGVIHVEKIYPLTRRLQRRFGWGDVCATPESARRAWEKGDMEELKTIMPEIAAVACARAPEASCGKDVGVEERIKTNLRLMLDTNRIDVGNLFGAMRSEVPALEDCLHKFEQKLGQCARCSSDSRECCTSCNLHLCEACGQVARREMAFHVACRTARAEAQQHVFWQHRELRLPFYVMDYTHWSDDEKLEWMRQEFALGQRVDLQTFAFKWMELFSEKVRGSVPQKAACIKLYARYAPDGAEERGWKKECDIPPFQRRLFQNVWGQDQDLCIECGKAAAPGKEHPVRRLGAHFCSEKCAAAGQISVCSKCGNRVSVEHPHCLDCRWGLPSAHARSSRKRSRLDDALDENENNHAKFARIVRCNSKPDPSHEPAWKQRRRS